MALSTNSHILFDALGFDATSLKSKQELEGYATESMVLTDYFDKKSQDN